MLARNWMTPTELGIPEDIYFALHSVMEKLETGQIKFRSAITIMLLGLFTQRARRTPAKYFNYCFYHAYGAACASGLVIDEIEPIGPYKEIKALGLARSLSPGFNELCTGGVQLHMRITTRMMAKAIDNYLRYGSPHWATIQDT